MLVWHDIFNSPLLWLLIGYIALLLFVGRFFIRDAKAIGQERAELNDAAERWRNK